ncbi:MAG TPA: hypothetical protein VF462_01825, partial [Micromonosporaceae bacterium]
MGPLVDEGVRPELAAPPAAPVACAGGRAEWSRLAWRLGDPGDPAALLEDFLADLGLPVRDLARGPAAAPAQHLASELCGAAVFVSAAAGARMAGVPDGPATPVPALPDLVAVAYRHRPEGGSGRAEPGGGAL